VELNLGSFYDDVSLAALDIPQSLEFHSVTVRLELALCTAALLPELKPGPCFLSAIIGQIA